MKQLRIMNVLEKWAFIILYISLKIVWKWHVNQLTFHKIKHKYIKYPKQWKVTRNSKKLGLIR